MDVHKASYSELLHEFYDRKVHFVLKNGESLTIRVDDIEDTSDGWDTFVFVLDGDNADDPVSLSLNEIKSAVLA